MGKKRKNRKAAEVKRFLASWREYKKSGGTKTKKEFKEYYRLKVHGIGKEIANSFTDIIDSAPIPDFVNDIFDNFGIGFGDADISDADIEADEAPDYGLQGQAFMGMPNYLIYGVLAYLIYTNK